MSEQGWRAPGFRESQLRQPGWRWRDGFGIALALLWLAALHAYRAAYVEPAAWGALCDLASPPLACVPRTALLWLQQYDLWGLGAVVLGLLALVSGRFALPAVLAGVAGVVDYNVTWGMLGACLGAWAWITQGLAARN